jgi:hypothetical protein
MLTLVRIGLTDSSSMSLSLDVSPYASLYPVLFADSKMEISIGIARGWLTNVTPSRNNPIRFEIGYKG